MWIFHSNSVVEFLQNGGTKEIRFALHDKQTGHPAQFNVHEVN